MFIDIFGPGNRKLESAYLGLGPRTEAEIITEAAAVVQRHAPKGAYCVIVSDRGVPSHYAIVSDIVLGKLGVITPGLALNRTRERVHAMRMRAS